MRDARSEIPSHDLTIPAVDGYGLAASRFEPVAAAEPCVVVIAPATGVARRYYGPFASYLAAAGFRVVTYDNRGVGDSRPRSLRGFEARMSDWGRLDLTGVLRWVGARYPGAPLALVGHSAGGQILGITEGLARIRALVAIAVQSGYWKLWPRPFRYLLAALWYGFVPAVTRLVGFFPGRTLHLFTDLPKGVALEWARWCRNPSYLVDDAGRALDTRFDELAAPLLAWSFEDDLVAPESAVDELMARFTRAGVERRHWTPQELGRRRIGHFGFFRAGKVPELWERLRIWLEASTSPRRPC